MYSLVTKKYHIEGSRNPLLSGEKIASCRKNKYYRLCSERSILLPSCRYLNPCRTDCRIRSIRKHDDPNGWHNQFHKRSLNGYIMKMISDFSNRISIFMDFFGMRKLSRRDQILIFLLFKADSILIITK